MKTLLVISDEHKNSLSEMQEITSALRCDTFAGGVRKRDVLRAVRTAKYDCLWFVGHGDRDAFVLSADETLNAEEIAQLARQCDAKHVVLNFCDSELMAYRIHYATGCDTIGVRRDIVTHEAMHFGALLAAKIAEGKGFVEAAREVGRSDEYVLLTKAEDEKKEAVLLKIEKQEHEIKKLKLYLLLSIAVNFLSLVLSVAGLLI